MTKERELLRRALEEISILSETYTDIHAYFAAEEGKEEANAHLIAAAPDLFSALQAILAVSETKDDPSWNAIKDCAKAALTKAKGEL